ncbi:hypothetical protein GGI09_003538 [Coemansia sp. S100]|nr:hypothetical protein GGI09_003538 [Coemansia sp. S100]
MSNSNSVKVEAPVTQEKRKVDSSDCQKRDEQIKRARSKDKSMLGPKPSGRDLPSSTPVRKDQFAPFYGKPMTSRGASAELLNLEPASFPTYSAFVYKYYETFCEAPGKARVDERMAIRWLADVLPNDLRNQISLGKPLNEVVTDLLKLDMVHQSAPRSGVPTALSQQEQQPIVQWQAAAFQGQPMWQWQHYWQVPPTVLQAPPYWQLLPQSYSAPKYIGAPGHLPLWPPHQYW